MRRSWFLFGTFALLVVALNQPTSAQPQPAITPEDAETLRKANLSPDDGPALVAYLKHRTVSDAEQGKIKELIRKLGADDFNERLAASEALEKFGPAAIGPLRATERDRDTDPETAYRAGLVLRKLEKIPHTAVAASAVRRVVQLKPPGAAAALIGFLPLADGDIQADEIRRALVELAAPDGKPDPALLAALKDPLSQRRSAAYVALTEGGSAKERIRIPEAFPLVRDAVRKEIDPDARFAGLWSLIVITREKEFVPELIAMIPQLTHNRLRQVEELLLHMAGEHPPGARFGKTGDSRTKARDAWAAWWSQKGAAVDLVKFPFTPKVRGFTEVVEMDTRFAQGRVVCLGPDMKEKWRLTQANNVSDARVLPNGRVLVAEMTVSRVGEWNPITGDQANVRVSQTQPIVAMPVADGGVLIAFRGSVVEYDKAGGKVFEYVRQTGDILTAARLPNGETVVIVQQQPNAPNCLRLDAKGKETGKTHTLGQVLDAHSMDVIGEDHILVCEVGQAAEYDLKTGKLVWKHDIHRPTSVQRLPNGNTLIASPEGSRGVEVNPSGEVVWDYSAPDQLRVLRIYHR